VKSLPALAGALAFALTVPTVAPAHRNPNAPPSWWLRGALCVHSHEGSWYDGGAPYYGGMQMDWDFMRDYGRTLLKRKGTADHWTPAEQLRVAYHGWQHRGWWPWPNTARVCGLL
jgi:hypothetical protein